MKITEHINYVGVQNPSMRIFDIIMETKYGTSYNSYLVHGEDYALIDTAHVDYKDEFIQNINAETKLNNIKYVILNHTEPDHAGSLRFLLEQNPDIEVYGSTAAIKNLGKIMNIEFKGHAVKPGEQLDLGAGVVLTFILAPNLHWPDSIFTYLEKDKTIFTCDVFGCHFCEPLVLDKYLKYKDEYRSELKNYFDCIFGPFKKFVLSGMAKIEGLEIETICTSHGPVLRELAEEVMATYKKWAAEPKSDKNIAIFYVSAYGYTKKMAEIFAEEIENAGIRVQLYHMLDYTMEEMSSVMNEASGVLFGSPTINRDALKPVWDLISMTDVINLKNKPALVFGSYGWSGEACGLLKNRLADLKYKVYEDTVRSVFNPTDEEILAVRTAAKKFVAMV